MMLKRAGLLLSGCGLYDGTEVQEAVLTLLSLDRAGARVEIFAPDRDQFDVVDHASAEVASGVTRNILTESCRLARGRVTPLSEARGDALQALFLPGGYGVAKNWLSGFGQFAEGRRPHDDVRRLLDPFLEKGRPIGAISLAEALIAGLLDEPLREDPFSTPPAEIRRHPHKNVHFSSGFMGSDRLGEVALGVDRLVEAVFNAVKG